MSDIKNFDLRKGQKLKLFDIQFEVLEKIGSGGFGDVWSLKNIKSGSKVVLKCQISNVRKQTPIEAGATEDEYKRFIQEAETFIEIDNHPNIAYFYGIEKLENRIAIIMEHVAGGSLDKWIESGKINNWNIILSIAIQISKAIAHAHKYGIVHRDLKPQNILVDRINDSEDGIIVKLTDFGLVKILRNEFLPNLLDSEEAKNGVSSNGNVDFATLSGLIIGTDGYMSPEQERELDINVDKDSDIFSFGILLCKLITGKLPFENGFIKSNEELAKYLSEFLSHHKNCPESLIYLITECLRYHPSDRWKESKQSKNFEYFQTIENHLKRIYVEKIGEAYTEKALIIEKFDLFAKYPYLPNGFKGVSLLTLGKNEKSIKYFDYALKIDPNAVEVYNNMGVALERLQRYKEAIECYDQGIQIDSRYSPFYHNKGITLRKLARRREAIESFDKAIELEPAYSKAYYMKGMTLVDLAKYDDLTLQCFDKAIELTPNYAAAHYQKGIVLAQMKRNNEAILSFDRALEYNPDYVRAHDSKGNVLADLNRYQEALKSFDKAIELEPENAVTYMNKGVALGQLRRYDEAIDCFDKGIELNPNIDAVYFNKSNALAAKQRYREAWDNYNKYLELSKKKSDGSNVKYVAQAIYK